MWTDTQTPHRHFLCHLMGVLGWLYQGTLSGTPKLKLKFIIFIMGLEGGLGLWATTL